MLKKIDKLLAKGLREGFAGGTKMEKSLRGSFHLESSHFENKDNIYHDEWFADRAGGGQEIVRIGKITYTRVYAGGTISLGKLKTLKISKGDIMTFLKKQIVENGEKIRLHSSFEPKAEGDWQYSYKILDADKEIPTTLGKEVIKYKRNLVFIHCFIISPVD